MGFVCLCFALFLSNLGQGMLQGEGRYKEAGRGAVGVYGVKFQKNQQRIVFLRRSLNK